jgi:hypothetical protein
MHRVLAAALLFSCIPACGDDDASSPAEGGCGTDERVDPFGLGLSKPGIQWTFQLMSATPAPPAKGDNEWVVQVQDPGGTPVEGITLSIRPWMPDHGHGSTRPATITPLASPGQFRISPLNLWMPGFWEITLSASKDGGQDSAVFGVCIEG